MKQVGKQIIELKGGYWALLFLAARVTDKGVADVLPGKKWKKSKEPILFVKEASGFERTMRMDSKSIKMQYPEPVAEATEKGLDLSKYILLKIGNDKDE